MKSIAKIALLGLILPVLILSSANALTPEQRPLGEVGFAIGGVYPQGDYVTFSDPGPGFNISLDLRPRSFRALALRFEFGGNFFESETTPATVYVDNLAFPAEKNVSQTAWTLHTGLQLGSDTQRGFFRPRVSFSPGLYIFNIETSYRIEDAAEDFHSENDTQAKFGWRAGFGTALFFKTGWGLSFDFLYDHVYSLHQLTDQDEFGRYIGVKESANFHSYLVGVVIPLSKL